MSRLTEDALGVTDQRRVFRERLMTRMREQNIRAADVARKADVSKDSISAYVTMRALPGPDTLKKIAKALKCKPEDLLPSGKGDEQIITQVREHTRAGYMVLIIRAPVPAKMAVEILSRVVQQLEADKGKD